VLRRWAARIDRLPDLFSLLVHQWGLLDFHDQSWRRSHRGLLAIRFHTELRDLNVHATTRPQQQHSAWPPIKEGAPQTTQRPCSNPHSLAGSQAEDVRVIVIPLPDPGVG
jgi:hypothetical protein